MKSMTGFAREDFSFDGISGTVQLKSYNNRFLDITISLPTQMSAYEPRIQKFLAERIKHGKVEFSIKMTSFNGDASVSLDIEMAKTLTRSLSALAEGCGLQEKPSLSLISSFDGVIQYRKDFDEDAMWPLFEKLLLVLFESYNSERVREGEATFSNILKELIRVEKGLDIVKDHIDHIEAAIRRQLVQKFNELLPKGYDEARIISELAVQIVRFSINEEVSRLSAHIDAFHETSTVEGQAKKLDFICQEMNREVNTIGSKNILIDIAKVVVEMKDAIENIREQLRNVE
jgi:uncharacterized protein (TIGR00255 family)